LRAAPIALVGFALCGCAAQSAQLDRSHGFGGTPADVPVDQVPVRGHQVDIEGFSQSARRFSVSGELLAVDANNLWVLEATNAITPVSRQEVLEIKIELYDSGSEISVWWTVIGTLSTISHGILLIITGPVWIVSGGTASFGASQANNLYVSADEAGELFQFARFPQGLPPGFGQQSPQYGSEWLSSQGAQH